MGADPESSTGHDGLVLCSSSSCTQVRVGVKEGPDCQSRAVTLRTCLSLPKALDQNMAGMASSAQEASTATTAAAYSRAGSAAARTYTVSPNTSAGRPWRMQT